MVNIHCEALEVGGGYLIPLPFCCLEKRTLGLDCHHLNIFVFSSFLWCEISGVHVHRETSWGNHF